jgi:hypothetical protein
MSRLFVLTQRPPTVSHGYPRKLHPADSFIRHTQAGEAVPPEPTKELWMRSRNVVISAVALVMGVFALVPSAGAATAGTIATFTVEAGGLAVTVPTSTVALDTGTVSTGASSAVGQLGPITITDTRGAMGSTWITTWSSTTFLTGTGSANEAISFDRIFYASGAATATSGTGTFAPLTSTPMNTAPAGRTVSWAAGMGNNSATWNPTLSFSLLSTQVAGTYTGTITLSVV